MHSLLTLFSLSFLLLIHNTLAIEPLYKSCSSSKNYTDSNQFARNLNQSMSQLISSAPCTGFALSSIGQLTSKVNALALCRGDANSTTCNTCIRTAFLELYNTCRYKTEAVIMFDNCLLRYSSAAFFGEVDNLQFMLVNADNVSSTVHNFDEKVIQMMNSLKVEASNSPKFYATKKMDIDGTPEKLYGLVQCTRDLASEDCAKCLKNAISELPICCGGRRGGRVLSGSCNVGFELYPFFTV